MNGFCLRCDIPYCGGTCPGCTVEKAQTLPPVWTRALSVLSDSSAPSVSAITERLSVGDLRVIFPLGSQFTHVISCVEFDVPSLSVKHLQLRLRDTPKDSRALAMSFEKAISFYKAAVEQNKEAKVLVHCVEGKSRSVAVAVAILLALDEFESVQSALNHVRKMRSVANPIPEFVRELDRFATVKDFMKVH